LAGTPDDSSWIECQLVGIAQFAAELGAVSATSVTAYRDDCQITVAGSSNVALTADEIQRAAEAGPSLAALDSGSPIAVPGAGATQWPEYREAAARLGIWASLSVPLFAGRGIPIAVLNLYGCDPDAMAHLTTAVYQVYDPDGTASRPNTGALDHGGTGLVAGLAGAFTVRGLIQRAIGMLMTDTHRTPDAAYLLLRLRAAETGATLRDTAVAVIAERQEAERQE
jgi:hypothetical protein